MRALGFNTHLVDLLKRIGDLSSSRLLVNGHLSEAFPIQRSVRQGDPLSMHLFVLYLHPLLSRLQQICGDDLVVAYADDVSVIATSTIKIEMMRETFDRFHIVSGAILNTRKTISIDVGFIDGNPLHVPWLQTVETVKILGVIFANCVRQMVQINWDTIVTNFGRQVWLHSMRSLTLHQKVTLLNTFITSKIWYLSSIIPPNTAHTAKLTSTMGSFLWRRLPARVPIQQLARNIEKGGLKLQLPALKCKALLMNRHLSEIDCMPFYRSIVFPENPTQAPPRLDCPCLKTVLQNYPRLPAQIRDRPSSDIIHQHYLDATDQPRVERNFPAADWQRIWRNIASKRLSSIQRSELYRFVNEKTEHRRLLHVIQRVDGGYCTHCNSPVETLQHKFSECQRVRAAWQLLQQKVATVLNGWRRLTFDELLRPVLRNIGPTKRNKILKLLVSYICFINSTDGRIDVDALGFNMITET